MSIVTTCVVFGQSQWELRSEAIVVAPDDPDVKLVPVDGEIVYGFFGDDGLRHATGWDPVVDPEWIATAFGTRRPSDDPSA
ncbi:MAG: hypothetical protein AAF480_14015 [Actinomycetota bacterium]